MELFHSNGANVVIADLSSSKLAAKALIAKLSSRVVFIPTDVLNWTSVTSLFSETKKRFGSIEIVVANAGITGTKPFFDFEDVDENGALREPKDTYNVIDVNVKGTLNSKSGSSI